MDKINVSVLNKNNERISDLSLSSNVFGRDFNEELINQYIRVYNTNQRVGNAHTKTRGEVSGSGKKPWKQKGTGRARVGSKRSPLWVKGGVTHGPRSKTFRLEMPKKMKIGSFLSILSNRFSNNQFNILENFTFSDFSTKDIKNLLLNLGINEKSVVFVTNGKNDKLVKSVNNLPRVSVRMVQNINTYDVLKNSLIIFDVESVKALESKYEAK